MADSSDLSPADAQRGDSRTADEIWVMHNDQAEGYDNRLAASWKGDTEGILIFTGLFSATVAAFIIEGYKTLSPDTGDATVALLSMILQQGAASANGTTRPLPSELQNSFTPTASAVRVNVLWFMSLIMSLTCALAATLMQQWARQYTQASQRSAAPYKRARIRTFLFQGVERFHLADAVEFIPALLHASVFLFFAGLVDFMMGINHTVAYTALTCSLLTAAAYTVSTVLPLFSLNSPYRTPLSGAVWSTWHGGAVALTWCLKMALQICAPILMAMRPSWKAQLPPLPPSGPRKWMQKINAVLQQCRVRLVLRMRVCVERGAADAPMTLDSDALGWALIQLDHAREWEQFIEGIAVLARSGAPGESAIVMLDLMTPRSARDSPLLATYIDSLLSQPNVSGLSHVGRDQRHLSCVTAIWCTLEAFNEDTTARSTPAYIWKEFRNSFHLCRDMDPRIAMTAICIRALLLRLAVIKGPLYEAAKMPNDLIWLRSEVGADWIRWTGAHTPHLVNLTSLVEAILPFLRQESLPDDSLEIVWRTIALACRGLEASAMDTGQADVWSYFFKITNEVKIHARMHSDHPSQTRYHRVLRFSRLLDLLRPVQLDLVYAHLPNPSPWPAMANSHHHHLAMDNLLSRFSIDKQELPGSRHEDNLLAWITAVWHVVEGYPWVTDDAAFEKALWLFGDVSLTRRLRTARDPFIVVIGRCMSGLIANRLLQMPITLPRNERIYAELLELPLHEVNHSFLDSTGNLANLIGVVKGILPVLMQEQLSNDCLAIIWRTLEILCEWVEFWVLQDTYEAIVALTGDIDAQARARCRQPWTVFEVRCVPRLLRLRALLRPIGEELRYAEERRRIVVDDDDEVW